MATLEGAQLRFPEAEDFFRQKVNLPTRRWDDLRHGAHVRGFSVAGMTKDDMLADVRAALDRQQREGVGFQAFKDAFNDLVDRTGWEFNAVGSTEAERRDWRARIIFNTNMRVSYMAGRFKQLTDPDVLKYRPFWRYRHNDSRHPRPLHVSWDGMVFAATDPWWHVHFPPNGWGCQCDVVAISRRQLKAMGKDGPDTPPGGQSYQARDPRTGEPETRWQGVDRGWEYNPGREWLHGVVPPELAKPLPPAPPLRVPGDPEPPPPPPLPPLPPARPADPSRLLPEGQTAEDYAAAFLAEFGATLDQGAIVRDVTGGVITIGRALFESRAADGTVLGIKADKRGRGRYMLLLADAIRDPDEVWADWVQAGDSVILMRSFIRRVQLPNGRGLFALFRWLKGGWMGVTTYDATASYVERQRTGALLYRRRE